jgi:uncharacterized protein GlcG (DUF336 family)
MLVSNQENYFLKQKLLTIAIISGVLGVGATHSSNAQEKENPQAVSQYGESISLEIAQKVMGRALTFAQKNNWTQSIAILDVGGHIKIQQTLDNTPYASIELAQQKANAALLYRKPTKVHQDALEHGSTIVLALPSAIPSEGGVPIVYKGKVIGSIGVSGGTSQQDGLVAQEGLNAILSQ